MKQLLDTNVCIDLLRSSNTQVSRAFLSAVANGSDLYVSSITVFELEMGVIRRGNKSTEVAALAHLIKGPISVASFDHDAAASSARLAAETLATGRQLSAYDALIAGHATSMGAQLVTADGNLASGLVDVDVINWRETAP